MTCEVCGWRRASRRGRCSVCYQFWRRVGRDKTTDEVMRSYERVLDRVQRILSTADDVAS